MAKRKPASTLKQYNAAIKAIKASTGVTHKQAQHAYRSAKVRLGRSPTAADARTKAVREEAAAAPRRIAAAQRAKERAVEASIARAKAPRAKRGVVAASPPAKRTRGGAPGGGGGPSGGGGGLRGGPVYYEYEDYIDIEPPEEIYGEVDGDS